MLVSLFSGVSGLGSHQTQMDVIANNIANVNTYGYKASRVTFQDMFYQTTSGATAPGSTTGGTNPVQVGVGSQVASIDVIHARSGFQTTGLGTDLAIAGEGFFQVVDGAGNLYYTRNGNLKIDKEGNLVDSTGNKVIGQSGGNITDEATGQDGIKLIVPELDARPAGVEKTILGSQITIEMLADGPEGNMSFVFADGKPEMTNTQGTVTTIYFDHSEKLVNIDDLKAQMDNAFQMGGVSLSTNDMRIEFNPDPELEVKPASVAGTISAVTSNTALTANAFSYTDATGTRVEISGVQATIIPSGAVGNEVEIEFVFGAADTIKSATWIGDKLQVNLPEGSEITEWDLTSLSKEAGGRGPDGVTGVSFQFSDGANEISSITPIKIATDNTGAAVPIANIVLPPSQGGFNLSITAGQTEERLDALIGDKISVQLFQGAATTTPSGAAVAMGDAVWDGRTLFMALDPAETYTADEINQIITNMGTMPDYTAGGTDPNYDNLDSMLRESEFSSIVTGLTMNFSGELSAANLPVYSATNTTGESFLLTASDGSASASQTMPDVGGGTVSVIMGESGEIYNGYEVVFKAADGATEEIRQAGTNQLIITLDSLSEEPTTQADIDKLFQAFLKTIDTTEQPELANMVITVEEDISAMDIRDNQDGTITMKLNGGANTHMQDIVPLLGTMTLTGGRYQTAQSVGDLTSLTIGADGLISATHDGDIIVLGRIEIATFDNPGGLEQVGSNYYRMTNNSGEPKKNVAGLGAAGGIVSGALEMSGVDLSASMTEMITTQRGFQANSRVITVSDTLLEELINLKR